MPEECHQCGAELNDDASFCCPKCGCPQLHITEAMTEAAADGTRTTGTAPPPKLPAILWRSALRLALVVAAVGGLLFAMASFFPALTLVSLLWILSGASIATGVYRRRHPRVPMNASIGARIGLSVGVLMVWSLAVAVAIVGLVARFGLHSMAQFDAEMTARMQEQVQKAIAANPAPAEMVQMMLSQEFRTGVILAGLMIFAALILGLSTVSGLVSGMVTVARDARSDGVA